MPDRKFVRPRIPLDLAERIDAVRGDVPFERWVQRALEQALDSPAMPLASDAAGSARKAARDAESDADRTEGIGSPRGRTTGSPMAPVPVPARASSRSIPPSGAATAPSASSPGESSRKFACPVVGCSWKGTNVPGGACPTHQVEAVPV